MSNTRSFLYLSILILSVTSISTGLCADVAPAQVVSNEFSIVVLPDTQCYADVRLGFSFKHWKRGDLSTNFLQQTTWIKNNARKLNIAMVLHVGDVTQTDHDPEWKIADKAFAMIDGVVPYCVAVGNHDIGYEPASGRWLSRPKFAASRATRYNEYFGPARFKDRPWYAGHLGDGGENSYAVFDSGDLKFIVVSLEFKPRNETVEWANKILDQHKERRAIILTHAYLDPENRLQTELPYGVEGNPGSDLWRKCVSIHKNIFMVASSHEYGERRLTGIGKNGNKVHQVSANYEDQNGGEGYLRIMTFSPSKNQIDVRTYSPVLNTSKTGPESQFALEYSLK